MAVQILDTEPTLRVGSRETVFEQAYVSHIERRNYDIHPDGQRFLMIKEGAATDADVPAAQIVVVLNWHQDLLERVPVP